MAGIRKVKARAGQIKEITNDEAQKLFEDKAIPEIKGNIIGVDIRQIDDNNIYLSWRGSIVGTIIIN